MIINIEIPEDLGEAIGKDAATKQLPIGEYILLGLACGIWDGYDGVHCDELLSDYVNKRRK